MVYHITVSGQFMSLTKGQIIKLAFWGQIIQHLTRRSLRNTMAQLSISYLCEVLGYVWKLFHEKRLCIFDLRRSSHWPELKRRHGVERTLKEFLSVLRPSSSSSSWSTATFVYNCWNLENLTFFNPWWRQWPKLSEIISLQAFKRCLPLVSTTIIKTFGSCCKKLLGTASHPVPERFMTKKGLDVSNSICILSLLLKCISSENNCPD